MAETNLLISLLKTVPTTDYLISVDGISILPAVKSKTDGVIPSSFLSVLHLPHQKVWLALLKKKMSPGSNHFSHLDGHHLRTTPLTWPITAGSFLVILIPESILHCAATQGREDLGKITLLLLKCPITYRIDT